MTATSFDFVLLTVCGWVNRRQLAAIAYLREENRVLREQQGGKGGKRPKLTDAQRRRLAEKGKAVGRKVLAELCSIATCSRSCAASPHPPRSSAGTGA